VKPYFFDIAYNYVGVDPDAKKETKVEKTEEKKSESGKKGWFWR
jgi:hypothetical protein